MSTCEHDWTGLWAHFGFLGPQDVHYHACRRCPRLLIGAGRDCDGDPSSHHVRVHTEAQPVPASEPREETPDA